MTLDDAMERATRDLDAAIEQRLVDLDARIRADLAATGRADDEAIDDPDAPWQRLSVEEAILREWAQLAVWRINALATIRQEFEASTRVDKLARARALSRHYESKS